MRYRQTLGARGEQLAAAFREQAGFQILEQNHGSPLGELDLVAREAAEIVFVEVKTRVGGPESAPDEAISQIKLDRISRLAELYLASRGLSESAWRVDVVAVVLDSRGRAQRIDHLRGAFL